MGRVFKNIILGVLILAIGQSLALDSEYKNSLNKIELVKTGENNYDVNLYTQKSYAQAPRIIKKSDYSYYILLPETKNSAPAASRNAQDISSVYANLYPYAGQDINNGYTKININTTKPIAFKLNVKNSAAAVVQSTQNKSVAVTNQSVEKKTSLASSQTKINSTKLQPKQSVTAKTTKTQAQNTKKTASKSNNITSVQKQTAKVSAKAQVKTAATPSKTAVKTTAKSVNKSAVATKQAQKPVSKVVASKVEQNPAKQDDDIQKPVSLPGEFTTKTPSNMAKEHIGDTKATVSQGDIFVPMANNADIEDDEMFNDEYSETNDSKFIAFYKNIVSTVTDKKNNLEEKLSTAGVSLSDILWMILIGFISLYVVFKILTRKHPQAKLRNKSEFKDKKHKARAQKKKGQYFIFDKNVKQTEFKDPDDPNKNYELEPYNPDNTLKYNKTPDVPAVSKPNYNLYEANDLGDIIEKAQEIEQGKDKIQAEKEKEAETKVIENFGLSEDALELYENEEHKENADAKMLEAPAAPVKKESQKQGLQQRLEETKIIEPKVSKDEEIQNEIPGLKVLSKVEIAPERGFMCVSYNDNINLIGYIFDDVFALHNFKMPKLQNYDIKFRLSERDNKGAYFIVKTDNTKLLIKVTRISMALEVVM